MLVRARRAKTIDFTCVSRKPTDIQRLCTKYGEIPRRRRTERAEVRRELEAKREGASEFDRRCIDLALEGKFDVKLKTKPTGVGNRGADSRWLARLYYEAVRQLKAAGWGYAPGIEATERVKEYATTELGRRVSAHDVRTAAKNYRKERAD